MATIFGFLYMVHIGATWRIRLNRPCAAAIRPYVKLLRPLVIIYACFTSYVIAVRWRSYRRLSEPGSPTSRGSHAQATPKKLKSPARGLTVVAAASMHSLLRPTCNHNYKVVAELQKVSDLDLDFGSDKGHLNIHNTCRTTSVPNHLTVSSRTTEIYGHLNIAKYRHSAKFELP